MTALKNAWAWVVRVWRNPKFEATLDTLVFIVGISTMLHADGAQQVLGFVITALSVWPIMLYTRNRPTITNVFIGKDVDVEELANEIRRRVNRNP